VESRRVPFSEDWGLLTAEKLRIRAQEYAHGTRLKETVRLNGETVESIPFCTTHQRRIIDDALTLAKLNVSF
jgi:hypothetical protein